MRPRILLLFATLCCVFAACKKSADDKLCDTTPAGFNLRFRITDTAGNDLLAMSQDRPEISQPCRTTPLTTAFTTYLIPGTADSGVLVHFVGLRTPVYGEGGNCFRLLFTFSSGDIDTVDWHYRQEEADNCTRQIIDYLSFNGIQAAQKNDGRYDYYRLIK